MGLPNNFVSNDPRWGVQDSFIQTHFDLSHVKIGQGSHDYDDQAPSVKLLVTKPELF